MVASSVPTPFYIGQNDTGENLDINLLQSGGTSVYTIPGGATAVLYLSSEPSFAAPVIVAGTMSIVNASTGTVRYVTGTVQGDTSIVGRFYGRVVLTLAGGAVLSFPNSPNNSTASSSPSYFEVVVSRKP